MALFAIPAFYYFALIVGAATYPGYSHVTNYERTGCGGCAQSCAVQRQHHPGRRGDFGRLDDVEELHNAGAGRPWSILAAVALFMWGVAMVMGGMFPMPDERHGAFDPGLAAPLIPLFILLALSPVEGRGSAIFWPSSSSHRS